MPEIDDILRQLSGLPEERRAEIQAELSQTVGDMKWVPNLGPQTEAYFCPADLLLYGGQGGGGKSDLLAGLALTHHRNSLLMRRQYTDLNALIDRVLQIHGSRAGFNGQPPPKLRVDDSDPAKRRLIEFGAAQKPGDEQHWQGQAHDLIGIDEVTQFLKSQVQFLMGWNRLRDESSLDEGIRVRTVFASNPPLSSSGMWIIGMFRPWLDPTHPNPAKPGELRWYITNPDGEEEEVEGPGDIREYTVNGKTETYIPRSRTFIPARLSDNPTLVRAGYQATLDAMPEPMRSAIRDGNFMAAKEDQYNQVIPTSWVLLANERWEEMKRSGDVGAMTAMGVDVARGGRDATTLSRRHGLWYDHLIVVPGRETPDGPSVVALVVQHVRDGAEIGLDAIGVGGSVQDHLKPTNIAYVPIQSAEGSTIRTRDGSFGFAHKRAEMWWSFREALDPDYGYDVALPPDTELQQELTAVTYEIRAGDPPKIWTASKDQIRGELGRSTDRADAVIYAWAVGELKGRNRSRALHAPLPDSEYDALRYGFA